MSAIIKEEDMKKANDVEKCKMLIEIAKGKKRYKDEKNKKN